MFGSRVTRRETDSPFIATHQGRERYVIFCPFSVRHDRVGVGRRSYGTYRDGCLIALTTQCSKLQAVQISPLSRAPAPLSPACSRDAHTGRVVTTGRGNYLIYCRLKRRVRGSILSSLVLRHEDVVLLVVTFG